MCPQLCGNSNLSSLFFSWLYHPFKFWFSANLKGRWGSTTPGVYIRKNARLKFIKSQSGIGVFVSYYVVFIFVFLPVIVPQCGKDFFDKLPSVRAKENTAIPPWIPPCSYQSSLVCVNAKKRRL